MIALTLLILLHQILIFKTQMLQFVYLFFVLVFMLEQFEPGLLSEIFILDVLL